MFPLPDLDPNRPLFRRQGKLLVPTESAGGPWHPQSLHGGPPGGLLADAIERNAVSGQRLARLTVDLPRRVPMAPLEVRCGVLRQGRRLALIAATLHAQGEEVARATGLLLASAPAPAQGAGPPLPPPPGPPPEIGATGPMVPPELAGKMPPGFHFEAQVAWALDQAVPWCWMRMPMPLVDQETCSPLVRLATLADFANATSSRLRHASRSGAAFSFINVDTHLHLIRPPEGDWFALRPVEVRAAAGIGFARVEVFDAGGLVGGIDQNSLAQQRSWSR